MLNWLKSASSSYLAHLTGYIVAGATIVSGLSPKTLPPQYAFVTALAGVIVNAGHHGYTFANASPVMQAAFQAAVKAATDAAASAVKTAPAVVLPLLVLIATMPGCGLVPAMNSPQAQPIITAAVEVAVAATEQRGISAERINGIAKQALVADQSTGATLATVAAVVNIQLLQLNLPAGDLAAAQLLELSLSAEIQTRIGTNPDLAAAQAAVADVLNAVITATGG